MNYEQLLVLHIEVTYEVSYVSSPISNLYVGLKVILDSE